MIELRIDCTPVSWKAHGGSGRRSFNPRHHERIYYQHFLRQQYSDVPYCRPLRMEYDFCFPVPPSWPQQKKIMAIAGKFMHVSRPDVSNLVKFCEDTLKEIVIEDDSLVVSLSARKFYGDIPYTLVKIFPIG